VPIIDASDPFGLVGQTLAGRFCVECKVAEGGFGVVYRAQQLTLARPVALKVLKIPAGVDDREAAFFEQTFATEARTMARLRHPHIVEIFDFGVSDQGGAGPLRWLAMEWLEGRTLEDLLNERRGRGVVQPAWVLQLMSPVFDAVAHAHRAGVVHCDLKPGNIFLAEVGGVVQAKILDFGIAKITAPDSNSEGEDDGATDERAAFSPEYAAPEQIMQATTGPFTDVHALGLVLSEMLTGELPYPGDGPECLAQAVAPQRPTPASKGVAVGGWERVLAKALALRPDDRYPSVDDFRRSLLSTIDRVVVQTDPRPMARVPAPACATSVTVPLPRKPTGAWRSLARDLRRVPMQLALVTAAVLLGVWAGPRWQLAAADITHPDRPPAAITSAPAATPQRPGVGACTPLIRKGCRGSSADSAPACWPSSEVVVGAPDVSSSSRSCAVSARSLAAALPLPRVQLGGSLAGKDSSRVSSSASLTALLRASTPASSGGAGAAPLSRPGFAMGSR
jgi:serine/threonine protein kinase